MVSISHVQAWNLSELLYIESSIFLGALPNNVPYTVIGSHISVARDRRHGMSHTSLDRFLVFAEGEKDGLDAGALHIRQLCPVSLLLWESELVALDEVVLVVLD